MKKLFPRYIFLIAFALVSCGTPNSITVVSHEDKLATLTPLPTATVAPTLAPTPTLIPTSTPTPIRITIKKLDADHILIPLATEVSIDLVRIPGGEFTMGSTQNDIDMLNKQLADYEYSYELLQNKIYQNDYWMGKTEITVAQFTVFARETGYKTQAEIEGKGYVYINNGDGLQEFAGANWRHPLGPNNNTEERLSHPVTYISWDDALAFCNWLKTISNVEIKLPSEAQWEKAARGTDHRMFPWGNAIPDKTRANFGDNIKDTTPVGQYGSAGESPYGLDDMAGNVWEWTSSTLKEYPYLTNDGREEQSPKFKVRRGGAFNSPWVRQRAAYRGVDITLNGAAYNYGFRIAANIP